MNAGPDALTITRPGYAIYITAVRWRASLQNAPAPAAFLAVVSWARCNLASANCRT